MDKNIQNQILLKLFLSTNQNQEDFFTDEGQLNWSNIEFYFMYAFPKIKKILNQEELDILIQIFPEQTHVFHPSNQLKIKEAINKMKEHDFSISVDMLKQLNAEELKDTRNKLPNSLFERPKIEELQWLKDNYLLEHYSLHHLNAIDVYHQTHDYSLVFEKISPNIEKYHVIIEDLFKRKITNAHTVHHVQKMSEKDLKNFIQKDPVFAFEIFSAQSFMNEFWCRNKEEFKLIFSLFPENYHFKNNLTFDIDCDDKAQLLKELLVGKKINWRNPPFQLSTILNPIEKLEDFHVVSNELFDETYFKNNQKKIETLLNEKEKIHFYVDYHSVDFSIDNFNILLRNQSFFNKMLCSLSEIDDFQDGMLDAYLYHLKNDKDNIKNIIIQEAPTIHDKLDKIEKILNYHIITENPLTENFHDKLYAQLSESEEFFNIALFNEIYNDLLEKENLYEMIEPKFRQKFPFIEKQLSEYIQEHLNFLNCFDFLAQEMELILEKDNWQNYAKKDEWVKLKQDFKILKPFMEFKENVRYIYHGDVFDFYQQVGLIDELKNQAILHNLHDIKKISEQKQHLNPEERKRLHYLSKLFFNDVHQTMSEKYNLTNTSDMVYDYFLTFKRGKNKLKHTYIYHMIEYGDIHDHLQDAQYQYDKNALLNQDEHFGLRQEDLIMNSKFYNEIEIFLLDYQRKNKAKKDNLLDIEKPFDLKINGEVINGFMEKSFYSLFDTQASDIDMLDFKKLKPFLNEKMLQEHLPQLCQETKQGFDLLMFLIEDLNIQKPDKIDLFFINFLLNMNKENKNEINSIILLSLRQHHENFLIEAPYQIDSLSNDSLQLIYQIREKNEIPEMSQAALSLLKKDDLESVQKYMQFLTVEHRNDIMLDILRQHDFSDCLSLMRKMPKDIRNAFSKIIPDEKIMEIFSNEEKQKEYVQFLKNNYLFIHFENKNGLDKFIALVKKNDDFLSLLSEKTIQKNIEKLLKEIPEQCLKHKFFTTYAPDIIEQIHFEKNRQNIFMFYGRENKIKRDLTVQEQNDLLSILLKQEKTNIKTLDFLSIDFLHSYFKNDQEFEYEYIRKNLIAHKNEMKQDILNAFPDDQHYFLFMQKMHENPVLTRYIKDMNGFFNDILDMEKFLNGWSMVSDHHYVTLENGLKNFLKNQDKEIIQEVKDILIKIDFPNYISFIFESNDEIKENFNQIFNEILQKHIEKIKPEILLNQISDGFWRINMKVSKHQYHAIDKLIDESVRRNDYVTLSDMYSSMKVLEPYELKRRLNAEQEKNIEQKLQALLENILIYNQLENTNIIDKSNFKKKKL